MGDTLNKSGREQLREWLAERGVTQTDLAEILEISPQTLWTWVSGRNSPSAIEARCLQVLCGIEPHSWLTEKQRRVLDRKLQRIDKVLHMKRSEDVFERVAGRIQTAC